MANSAPTLKLRPKALPKFALRAISKRATSPSLLILKPLSVRVNSPKSSSLSVPLTISSISGLAPAADNLNSTAPLILNLSAIVSVPANNKLKPPVILISSTVSTYSPLLSFSKPAKKFLPPIDCCFVLNVSMVWTDPKVLSSKRRIPPSFTLGILVLTSESATRPTTPVFLPA